MLYVVENIWGQGRFFSNLTAAEEAYFEEVAWCGYAELVNVTTREVLRTSY